MTRSRLGIGDVFEIDTGAGLAYIQYTHLHPHTGSLIRAIVGLVASPRADACEIASQQTRFVAFFPIAMAHRKGLARKVGWCAVPADSSQFPIMLWPKPDLSGGKPSWVVWDGQRDVSKPLDVLTPEQRRLPHVSVVDPGSLISWLRSPDWDWETEKDLMEAPPTDDSDESPVGEGMRHFLYFADERTARQAANRARRLGGTVDVSDAGDQWAVVLSTEREGLEDDLYQLADDLGGEYDGSEVAIR